MILSLVTLERQLRGLEAENQRLRDLVAAVRWDRTDCHQSTREEVRKCSNP